MKTTKRSKRNGRGMRISRHAIDNVAKRIGEKFDPERIILFGSYAYGKPHPFGMDILVRAPNQLRERIAMGDYFLREIVTKGKVVYERSHR